MRFGVKGLGFRVHLLRIIVIIIVVTLLNIIAIIPALIISIFIIPSLPDLRRCESAPSVPITDDDWPECEVQAASYPRVYGSLGFRA